MNPGLGEHASLCSLALHPQPEPPIPPWAVGLSSSPPAPGTPGLHHLGTSHLQCFLLEAQSRGKVGGEPFAISPVCFSLKQDKGCFSLVWFGSSQLSWECRSGGHTHCGALSPNSFHICTLGLGKRGPGSNDGLPSAKVGKCGKLELLPL